ncbi:hypothetical protein ASPZODRAFT_2114122 [Penicilliopsis zonata CBS 506.65]|uniref:F-box domain-containing protein n=1 Tax=Penicilliopsis zonata CBS 506.65 TaxID=1073090 RepID=A0A1L9S8T3_9EURO|nr:hypothetical protein ASPZODRAFT_2114122 [Penicilliopsis zonata CBS 506.65]OJJ43570.1 hypothetical protein ASPZODRAFT_2114122 [Penicilliopsis zonata CBS 506.65]
MRCYRVTGVGQELDKINGQDSRWGYFSVAREYNKAFLGVPDETDPGMLTVYHPRLSWWNIGEQLKRDWWTLILCVHMRCWTLAQRIIGCTVDSEHLNPVAALLLRQARDNLDPYADPRPLKIASMKKLIESHSKEKKKKEKKECSRVSLLPYEIRCAILDHLDYQAFPRLLEAMQYPLEDSYWRSRMAVYLLGMDEVVETVQQQKGPLDWPGLCVATEGLDASTDAFKLRHQVVNTLQEVKVQLCRYLKGEQSISLPDVLNQIQDEMIQEFWEDHEVLLKDWDWVNPNMMQCLIDAGFLPDSSI